LKWKEWLSLLRYMTRYWALIKAIKQKWGSGV